MISLIKLHQKYLFSKKNIIIIGIVILLAIMLSILLIKPQLNTTDNWIMRESIETNYEQIYFTFNKIIMILFSSSLFTIHFNNKNDEYKMLLLTDISKKKYYITKILTIVLLIIVINFIIFINYILIGLVFTKWFILKTEIAIYFLEITLLSIVYGLLSLFFVIIFKNMYSVLLSFGIYFIREMIVDFDYDKRIVKYVDILFPNFEVGGLIDNDMIYIIFTIFHFIILMLFYLFISYQIYAKNE